MRFYLCDDCDPQGYCRRLTSQIVMPEELTPALIGDVRRFMATCDFSRDAWPPYLISGYRDYPGRILHPNGLELNLNTHLLTGRSVRYWYRDLCEPIPEGVVPRLRIEALGRFIVLATILRAMHPVAAGAWGTGGAPLPDPGIQPLPPMKSDECPYREIAVIPPDGYVGCLHDKDGLFGGIPPFLGKNS